MSEEEIIKTLNNLNEEKLPYALTIFEKQAIKGLLDLYNEQKEKIQSLNNQLDFIAEQNRYIEKQSFYLDRLEKEFQGQRIEIEKMQKNYEEVIDKMEYEMGYEYINKDKIRDKIKELEKEKEKYKGDKGLIYNQIGFIQSGINVLNKLLEEK